MDFEAMRIMTLSPPWNKNNIENGSVYENLQPRGDRVDKSLEAPFRSPVIK
jgi:hypothetical protein